MKKLLTTTCIALYVNAAQALTIKKPSFVGEITPDKVDAAATEVNFWISAVFMAAVALSATRPGFYFLKSEKEKAMDASTDILVGVGFGVVFAGIVFAVMSKLGS